MEKKKKGNLDLEYILYGEKKPHGFGLIAQSLVAISRYLFAPHKLTIGDGRRLKEIHEKTGLRFPLKSEWVNRK